MARFLACPTLVPRAIMGPLILVFSGIGAYAGNHNLHTVRIMIGFGFLDHNAQRYGFSPPGGSAEPPT